MNPKKQHPNEIFLKYLVDGEIAEIKSYKLLLTDHFMIRGS
jgi:hypothetical protein